MLYGWLSINPFADPAPTLDAMTAALKSGPAQVSRTWTWPGFGIGLIDVPFRDARREERMLPEPARSGDGRCVWMTGEAFDWPSHGGLRNAAESRDVSFRQRLMNALRGGGPEAIADLDGEYQIAVWEPSARRLVLLNDRFGALPLYTASSPAGIAFAGGVRGVLMAPEIACEPDPDAIREAVTFGGFRLGSRTNVRGVTMVPPASVVTLTPLGIEARRYWTWSELPQPGEVDRAALLEETRNAWRHAVARRVDGASKPGLTLSGGLDSRAILAEATRQVGPMAALTYGVLESDDVKIARRAAAAVDARWDVYPLYAEGWLDRRTARIWETDGLMDLVDLMHAESIDRMPEQFDVYLSGYVGDAVTGSTLFTIDNAVDLVASMPYYGGELGISYPEALGIGEEMIARTPGPPRFAPYEHKLPQSTNRITAAARTCVRVRRPFVDYRFFEIAQRVPAPWRVHHAWHEQWLGSTYPELFATIPNQRTSVPVCSSKTRWQITRSARFAWRRTLGALRSAGIPVTVPERSYHPDERFWSAPDARRQIEETILRPDALACEYFGRARVRSTVNQFFNRDGVAVQVIGALYVFEHYHRHLASRLAEIRRKATLVPC